MLTEPRPVDQRRPRSCATTASVVESLAEAPDHLANWIDAAAFDRNQPSMFFPELKYRAGLNSQRFLEPFRNRNLAPLVNAPFHSFILSDGHMVSR
jgi:hypothetical protein